MKKFNLKKEQRKLWLRTHKTDIIKYGSVGLCMFLLGMTIMYFSQAKYSTKVTFDVIDANVSHFTTGDVVLTYNVDGEDISTMENNGTKYTLIDYSCGNSETVTWDNETWSVNILNISGKAKCKLYFETLPPASTPELYNTLIPVYFNERGNVLKADSSNTNNNWYDYTGHKWANAVAVSSDKVSTYNSAAVGSSISSSDILQMYVWIPRYKYKLFNTGSGTSINEQMIDIRFEDKNTAKSNGSTNNTWLTHPAFTFGDHELNGLWVGKFETAYNGTSQGQANGVSYPSSDNALFTCTNETCSSASNIRILPNVNSIRRETVGNMFNISRSIASSGGVGLSPSNTDSHMMKNMEWGAVAYLTNSLYGRYKNPTTCVSGGCNIWINPYREGQDANNKTLRTGCAGNTVDANNGTVCNEWNTALGVHASTTDNMYGVYDMSGGEEEYVMGNVAMSSSYTWQAGSSGLTSAPNSKYYDAYTNNTNNNLSHNNGKLGDATRETLKIYRNQYGGWYGDYSIFPSSTNVFFMRGLGMNSGSFAGSFSFDAGDGSATWYTTGTFRVVLSSP